MTMKQNYMFGANASIGSPNGDLVVLDICKTLMGGENVQEILSWLAC